VTDETDLTDEQLARMSGDELDAWFDARSVGPWEPNEGAERPAARTMTSITVRMPADLLVELRAAAARHRQPYQRYMKDLLMLALRQVQAADRLHAAPAQLRITPDQLRELNRNGELEVHIRLASRQATGREALPLSAFCPPGRVRIERMAKARRVRRAVERAGWTLVRTRGSHRIYRRGTALVPFAYHDAADLGGPAMAIVAREFGMTVDELRRLL